MRIGFNVLLNVELSSYLSEHSTLLSREQKDEECDATGDDSPRDAAHSTEAGNIIFEIIIENLKEYFSLLPVFATGQFPAG